MVCWESKHSACRARHQPSMESFHNNMKRILYFSREKFTKHKMDWLIYHLVGDVLTHYWYGVWCKSLGLYKTKNKKASLLMLY